MAIELAGAKMVAPFYGTSLYVWASVLTVTLGGLTTGYFLGGWATYRYPAMKMLIGVLLAGTVLISIMPLLALKIMPATSGLGLRMGSLVSCTLFMFLPLVCMGMVSPAIIHISNQELKGTGRTAGNVYAISTVGGILMTLLMGFFLLPDLGDPQFGLSDRYAAGGHGSHAGHTIPAIQVLGHCGCLCDCIFLPGSGKALHRS